MLDTDSVIAPVIADRTDHSTDWFRHAVSTPSESCYFDRDGTRLHLLRWGWEGNSDKPAVLLVHGFLAHAHWWDAIAAELAEDYRVTALDISGMGDSGPRSSYPFDWAARDILATIEYLDMGPATVVAHSYGGSRTLMASALKPGAIAHAIVMDTYYNFAGEDPPGSAQSTGRKTYPTLPEALQRYRLMPSNTDIPPDVLQHVARHSLQKFGPGWSWKFDPELMIREEEDGESILRRVDACVDYVHAEKSDLVSKDRARRIMEALPHKRLDSPITFPGVHHHLLLERPFAVSQLIRALLRGDSQPELP